MENDTTTSTWFEGKKEGKKEEKKKKRKTGMNVIASPNEKLRVFAGSVVFLESKLARFDP